MFRPAALLAALAAFAAPAAAQSVSAAHPETVVSALTDAGFIVTLGTDDYGDPKIDATTRGVAFTVYFYGCAEDGTACRDLYFSSGFDLDEGLALPTINDWNADALMGLAYLDDEGDPFVTHFVAGVDGMSRFAFEELMDDWDNTLDAFLAHIGW